MIDVVLVVLCSIVSEKPTQVEGDHVKCPTLGGRGCHQSPCQSSSSAQEGDVGGLIDKCISVTHGVPGPYAHIWTLCPLPPLDSYAYVGIAC